MFTDCSKINKYINKEKIKHVADFSSLNLPSVDQNVPVLTRPHTDSQEGGIPAYSP